jgi:peptidoglycan L-alanyl-D-glutamate endopeptidase CwlK
VANIEKNLPPLLDALQQFGLADRTMVLVALSTIRAETPWFVPISERATLFNTSRGGQPFDLYDRRMDLGNQGPPDGAMFKGRGFMLLTGRANYERVDRALGLGNSLVTRPELENDPKIAAQTLAFFLKNVETPIREAVASGDLATVRRLVNGGSHGLADFTDTFTRGQVLLPEHD